MKMKNIILYLFSFILLWEWLIPLEIATDTAYSFIFIVFIGVSLLLKFLHVKWYISYLIKLTLMLFFIHQVFYDQPFFSITWVSLFIEEILYNVSLMNGTQWLKLTPVFRTCLFFVMLWLLIYLIYYWVVHKSRIFLFLFLTIFYITFLDTFTPYDATTAIVRLIVVGFLMLVFLSFERLYRQEKIQIERTHHYKWVLPLVFLLSISMIIGFLSPKSAPIWPDPVPYIQKMGSHDEEETTSIGMSKIGYGENDLRLGGPFAADDTTVFLAYQKERHYWRVETKDVYTGKGWALSNGNVVETGLNVSEYMDIVDDSIEEAELSARVEISQKYHHQHFMYPVETKRIESGEENDVVYYHETLEKLEPKERTLSYTVHYKKPVFQIDKLKEVKNEQLPAFFSRQYTQLPTELPERVKELAVSITEEEETLYDKVKAVENFFKSQPFRYETKDVAIPEYEQDYVDQFLFETQKGYCDNFSTAMAVLLRSIDIPARWVKGYTEGEYVEPLDDGVFVYEVTNNNAHSWVEVYFDGIGWVPFEPTIGFQNSAQFTFNYDDEPEREIEESNEEERVKEEVTQTTESNSSNWMLVISGLGKWFWIVITFLSFFTIIGWLTRKRWVWRWTIWRLKHSKDKARFSKAYHALLKHLEWYGLKKQDGQTLRQFAKYVDKSFRTSEMSTLTERYERVLYSGSNEEKEWVDSVELWENLIKKTSY